MVEQQHSQESTVVEVKNLSVQFENFIAVNNISFSVKRGEIFGFLGANGAGKTTTIRVLCGLLNPTSGIARVAEYNSSLESIQIKAIVGYISQKLTLYQDLTVAENLNFIAAIRNIDKKTYLKRRKKLLEFIQFDQLIETYVRDLPGGTKQQVALVGALLHDPKIIFLDEPTAGVSPVARVTFWSLIKELSKQGKTIFVTTHYMDEAEQCERVALMRDGKIVALDSIPELKAKTFPMPMFEFSPKYPLKFEEILDLKKQALFSFFEPYGLKFHAVVDSQNSWEQLESKFKAKFDIRRIEPSLEDVFIKTVEGKML